MAILGAILASSYRTDTTRSGLAEARSQAALLANDVVGPVLGPVPLNGAIPAGTATALTAAFSRAKNDGKLLRLRLRDMSGTVVWSDDGSGLAVAEADDEVLDALHGETVSRLSRLNADANDDGPLGPRVVEIYRPITTADPLAAARQLGVLEMYVPYAPIERDVTAGMRQMYALMAVGLGALWLVLAAISASTTRRLRRQAQRLAYLAEHDEASGLLNRVGFERAIADRVDADPEQPPAVAVVNISRFREINEALGYSAGDAVLLEVGRRVVAASGPAAVVARLGGDEFAVADFGGGEGDAHLLDALGLRAWAEGFQAAVSEPIEAGGVPVIVEVAVGYDRAELGQSVDAALRRADAALADAKTAVPSIAGYLGPADPGDASRIALLARLREAIPAGELELHYQPKIRVADGEVVAVEALLRWRLDGTLLPPSAFLPSVEQTALIHPVTEWVARNALQQLDEWGPDAAGIAVAVNVSARNLSDPGFGDRLIAIVDELGADPRRIIVEVTETALVADPDAARRALTALHDAGIAVSIDDFGQGQTSLAYLAALPVDELKIDRAFVARSAEPTQAAILRSVTQLGHSLGLEVVAEGVEDQHTLDRLAVFGVDVAQGYFIARPMPGAQFLPWLAAQVRQPRALGVGG